MSALHLEISRNLRNEGERLGRAGLSQRAHDLIMEYATKHPNGHYKAAIELAGRMRAISLAARVDSYWKEKTDHGFYSEAEYGLPQFTTRQEGQD